MIASVHVVFEDKRGTKLRYWVRSHAAEHGAQADRADVLATALILPGVSAFQHTPGSSPIRAASVPPGCSPVGLRQPVPRESG